MAVDKLPMAHGSDKLLSEGLAESDEGYNQGNNEIRGMIS